MRVITPRATPVVRAPAPSVPPVSDAELRPPTLRAPVSIITPLSELELREGSILIGRLPECDVMIDDALVSRMHARLTVRDDGVVVEDLHSTNGVYVNGARITHNAQLREGDRLLIGTTEISLFEARPNARVAPLRPRREEPRPPAPALGPAILPAPIRPILPISSAPPTSSAVPVSAQAPRRPGFGKLELLLDELVPEPTEGVAEPGSKPRARISSAPSTARADALEVIGALAERLAGAGNVDEARRVLSSHLKRILQGATAGLTVPEELCRLASRNALALARWTGQSSWLDYVVELHLAARRVMHPETLVVFESVLLSLGDVDKQLFVYYVDGLRGERSFMSAEECGVLDRLIVLAEV